MSTFVSATRKREADKKRTHSVAPAPLDATPSVRHRIRAEGEFDRINELLIRTIAQLDQLHEDLIRYVAQSQENATRSDQRHVQLIAMHRDTHRALKELSEKKSGEEKQ